MEPVMEALAAQGYFCGLMPFLCLRMQEMVEHHDEGGFVVTFQDLPGCVTCGETIESAGANAADAMQC